MVYKESYYPGIDEFDSSWRMTPSPVLNLLENTAVHNMLSLSEKVADKGISWVIVQWRISVLSSPVLGEKLGVSQWARPSSSEKSAFLDFAVTGRNSRECIRACAKTSLVNIAKGERLPITQEIIDTFGAGDEAALEGGLPFLEECKEYVSAVPLTLRRSDMDFNGHVHNVRYMDFALEALPEEVYSKGGFREIDLVYRSPLAPGDSPQARLGKEGERYLVGIYSGDRLCALARFLV